MVKKKLLILSIVICISFFTIPSHAGIIYSNNFENENVSCWNNTSDEWRNCGDFKDIGQGARMQLSNLHSRSGNYSAVWRVRSNEDRGQAYIELVSKPNWYKGYDDLYVQMWNYYTGDDGTFDHGTQPKHMRIYGTNGSSKGLEVVFHVMDRDNDRDSESIKIAYNGPPDMPDWGAAYASWNAPNNKWVCFEFHVKLNTPGKSDGLVEFWIDGQRKIYKSGLNIRANTERLMNRVLVGGWWSNSGKNSDQYSYRYMDDFVISTEYIGNNGSVSNTSSSASSNNTGSIPPPPTMIRVIGSEP